MVIEITDLVKQITLFLMLYKNIPNQSSLILYKVLKISFPPILIII